MFDKVKKLFTQNFFDTKIKNITNEVSNENQDSIDLLYQAIDNKLRYGSSLIKNIIDYRKSWIYSSNATIECDQELLLRLKNELYIDDIFDKLVTLSELEGRWLVFIKPFNNFFSIEIISFRNYKYTYELNEVGEVSKIKIIDKFGKEKVFDKENSNFVFINTSSNLGNNLLPNIAYVIKYIQNIDKAIETMRTLNHVLGVNTLVFKTKDWSDAVKLSSIINNKKTDNNNPYDDSMRKWKIGDGIVAPTDVSVINIGKDSIESIKDEIITNLQIVSGHTGVPIHLLGFPEMLSNRATAQELAESITNKIQIERNQNKRGFEKIISTIAILSNQLYNTAYSIDCHISIPPTSMSEKKLIYEIYMNLYKERIISKKTLREMIPEVDPLVEEEREAEEEAKLDERIRDAVDRVSYE